MATLTEALRSDVEAGHRAGCKSILILNPQTEDKNEGFAPAEFETESLLQAADFSLQAHWFNEISFWDFSF